MAATVVQAITGGYVQWNNYGPTTQALTFGSAVTAGNSVIVICSGYHPAFTHTAPTDTASNVYAIPQDSVSGEADSGTPAFAAQAFIYAAHNCAAFTVVTLNGLAGGIYGQVTAIEVSGLDASPNDRAGAAQQLGPTSTDGNVAIGTLAQAEEFVVAVLANTDVLADVNITGPTGGGTYTNLYVEQDGGNNSAGSADHTVTSATTGFTAQYSHDNLTQSTTDWAVAVATFRVAAAGAPVFDTAPAIASETTSAYTVSYDGGPIADNIYAGVWARGATPPTAAQVEAGTGARGTATEAVTGAADTLVITPAETPKFPPGDLYFVLKDGATYSGVASLLNKLLDAPTGYEHVVVAGTPVGWLAGSGAVAGDVMQAQTTVSPGGYARTQNPDGSFSYAAGGDGTRQSFLAWYYDVSAVAWGDAAPVTIYVNNEAPILAPGVTVPVEISALEDIAISAVNVAFRGQDQEGDTLTVTTQTGTLPAGLTLSTPNITGTPTTVGIVRTVHRLTDIVGDFLDIEFAWVIRPARPLFLGFVLDLSLEIGDAMTPVDFSTEFGHDTNPDPAMTFTLKKVGIAGIVTTAVGSSQAGRALTVADASGISVGNYISVGGSILVLVLAKYSNTLELATAISWITGDNVSRATALDATVIGLTQNTNGTLSGTPTVFATTSNLVIRASDGTQIKDSSVFSIEVESSAMSPLGRREQRERHASLVQV